MSKLQSKFVLGCVVVVVVAVALHFRRSEPDAGAPPLTHLDPPSAPNNILSQINQKMLPKASAPLVPMKSIDEMVKLYEGQKWLVRKYGDGRTKRILGMRFHLGELSDTRVTQFAKNVVSVFGTLPGNIADHAELLQDSPLLSPVDGVRGFRFPQTFQGYPVIDGSLKVFVDFADASVTTVEGADLQPIHGTLEKRAILPVALAAQRANAARNLALKPYSPGGQLEVAVSPQGKPVLVYRFVSIENAGKVSGENSNSGHSSEVWVNAWTGKVLRNRATGIDG